MKYVLELSRENIGLLRQYFNLRPFVMQAAFLMTDVVHKPGYCKLELHDFKSLASEDYEWRTSGGLSFHAAAYMDALRQASDTDKSMIYMHSHGKRSPSCVHTDETMIFRIAYAYIPFGIHASLYYNNDEIRGKIWLPGLKTAPLNIIIK